MRKKYLKEQIDSLKNLVFFRDKEINHLNTYISDLCDKMNIISKELQTLKKRYSNEVMEINNIVNMLENKLIDTNKELEDIKTQNISLKRENLTWYQKTEILKGQLDTSKSIITELNKKLISSKKSVKKYCSNKSEGI